MRWAANLATQMRCWCFIRHWQSAACAHMAACGPTACQSVQRLPALQLCWSELTADTQQQQQPLGATFCAHTVKPGHLRSVHLTAPRRQHKIDRFYL